MKKFKGLTITIEQDADAENPREEQDYLGTMVHWHRRSSVGDKFIQPDDVQRLIDLHPARMVAGLPVRTQWAHCSYHPIRRPMGLWAGGDYLRHP